VKTAILSILFLLLVACSDRQTPSYDETDAPEQSTDGVWHAAKLRGVTFRAVGQEPGWLLEITSGESIVLSTNYGENVSHYAYVEPAMYAAEGRTQYVMEDANLVVEIRGFPCTDVMSGEEFDVSVSVIEAERRLEGCGRTLF